MGPRKVRTETWWSDAEERVKIGVRIFAEIEKKARFLEFEAEADAELTGLVTSSRSAASRQIRAVLKSNCYSRTTLQAATLFCRPSFRSTCISIEFLSLVGCFARASAQRVCSSILCTPHSRRRI